MDSKLKRKETSETMWEAQAGNFTTSKKVNIDFFVLEFSAKNIAMWKCHIGEYTNEGYDIILGRHIINTLGIDIKFYENVIICGECFI